MNVPRAAQRSRLTYSSVRPDALVVHREPLDPDPAPASWLPGPEPRLEGPDPVRLCEPLLDGHEAEYVETAVKSGWISSGGPFVGEFEARVAERVGVEHAVSCSSGTAAIHLALAALGIQPGDEVIVPSFTMIATAAAVAYCGAVPVFVDSEPTTWNIDVEKIERAITPQTRAVIAVHTYGHPADMDPIMQIATRHRLWVIEDAAEAFGATYRRRPVGSLAHAACFSLYGNKVLTAGEGGFVTTDIAELASAMRSLRGHAHAESRYFWHEEIGFSYRMTNLQAAVALAQVEHCEDLVARRRANKRRYDARLRDLDGIETPPEAPWATSVHWMYGVLVDGASGVTRDRLRAHLARAGVETRGFFIPLHLQPVFADTDRRTRFAVAERLGRDGLYLPSGPTLTSAQTDRVTSAIASAFADSAISR